MLTEQFKKEALKRVANLSREELVEILLDIGSKPCSSEMNTYRVGRLETCEKEPQMEEFQYQTLIKECYLSCLVDVADDHTYGMVCCDIDEELVA